VQGETTLLEKKKEGYVEGGAKVASLKVNGVDDREKSLL